MKALRFLGMALLMVMLAVNFTACSDDDEPTVGTSQDFIGRWTLTWTKGWEFDSDGFKDTWDEADDGEDLIFKADGTGRMESQYGLLRTTFSSGIIVFIMVVPLKLFN